MMGLLMELGPWLLTSFVLFLSVFYLYVKLKFRYFEQRGIPYDRPTFPFGSFTSAVLSKKSVTFIFADIYTKYKNHKIVGFFSLFKKQILIRDPKLIKDVLVKDFDVFQDRGVYYNKTIDPLSAHLFSLEGDTWKMLRAKLTPTFTSGKLKGMQSIVIDCAKMMSDFIVANNFRKTNFECQTVSAKFAQSVISAAAFGLDNNCFSENNSMFSEMVKKMVEPTIERICTFILMFNCEVAKTLNIRLVPESVEMFFRGVVNDAVKFRGLNKINRNDYLQQLIDLKTSDTVGSPVRLTEDEMVAQAFLFIMAGSETTSTTMSFCLYELSQNPDIQDRLQRELDELSDLSYDSIHDCQYLDMVVKETLRKYPPLGFLVRQCSRDYKVSESDFIIEKGTQVIVSVQGIHNDPDLFPDPEVFNPERFSKQNKDNIKAYTYMPFGEGPRYCIGKRFAVMVVKTGLAALLRSFTVNCQDISTSIVTPFKIEPRTIITMAYKGLWLKFKDRHSV